MLVYVPLRTFEDSVAWFGSSDAVETMLSAANVLQVIHEVHPHAEFLQEHPCVRAWRGYEVSLAAYAYMLYEAHKDTAKIVDDYDKVLAYHMDLATTDEYSMAHPPWLGTASLHFSHLQFLVARNPDEYPTTLRTIHAKALPFHTELIWE